MRRLSFALVLGLVIKAQFVVSHAGSQGGEEIQDAHRQTLQAIDLAAVLRLAGARNLDVQIARQSLAEARANEQIAIEQFFPYLAPGVSYLRHEGNIQTSQGPLIDVNSNLYRSGVWASGQINLGDALFSSLATHRLVQAAGFATDGQLQESVFQAANAYFEVAGARAAHGVALESTRLARGYAVEVDQAVNAGLAFRGDLFRASTEVARDQLTADQARERQRLAAANLSRLLHLDSTIELIPVEVDLSPIKLPFTDRPLTSLVIDALSARPELKQYAAQLEAARKRRQGAVFGPLVPNVTAQVFDGGAGGGAGSPGPGTDFAHSADYSVGLSWKIGPGGLFDVGNIHASDARLKRSELQLEKERDVVSQEVVDAHTRVHASARQIADARRALEASKQALDLTRQRREFAVGEVLENIQAEQDYTRARLDYVNAIAENNKAQFALRRALGTVVGAEPPPGHRFKNGKSERLFSDLVQGSISR